jgi:hypothetical protein
MAIAQRLGGVEAHFLCGRTRDVLAHGLEPMSLYFPAAVTTFAKMPDGQWISGINALLSLLVGPDATEGGECRNHADAVANIQRIEFTTLYEDLVLAALAVRDIDPLLLAENQWLMHRPGYWALLCERIGRGGDSQALISTLSQIWDEEKALVEIPEQVVEAWLRMAERRSVIPRPAPDLLQILHRVDLEKLARTRPDLIKRAQNVLTELGELRAIKWPGR